MNHFMAFPIFDKPKEQIMTKYILKRLLLILPSLLLVVLVIYSLLTFVSFGKPFSLTLYRGDYLDTIFNLFHVKGGFFSRYIRYCWNVLVRLDFGSSRETGLTITEELLPRLNRTMLLTVLSLTVSAVIGIPLGIGAAMNQNGWQDRLVSISTLLLSSVPSYVLTIIFVLIFALYLGILPVSGTENWASYILPVIVISMGSIAETTQITRSAVSSVKNQQFISASKGLGIPSGQLIYRHILRNSMIPIVSTLAQNASAVLGSSLIVENFFTIPALGSYLIKAVNDRNFTRVLGCSFVIASALILINFAADMIKIMIDPKLRTSINSRKADNV